MDRESPELIERQMEQTRESLTEKVSLLEDKVIGQLNSATDTVQGTVESVQETVQSVKGAVQDTVQSVSDTVKESVQSMADCMKETMDVRKHVRAQPLTMVGGAAALGFVTGLLLFRPRAAVGPSIPFTAAPVPTYVPVAQSTRPGWLNDLLDMGMREVKKLAEQALSTATTSLKQSVETGIPKLIDSAIPEVGHRHNTPHNGNGAATFAR
ncbi:MAG TPA: hypothetical protein VHR66_29485 [Gemmataceae bacterium]|jgi:ElaB/YqjD/DUF883 family membrane-anchored ribosome-binding protein|nr:hypothetical protein [Gemmataceae bacterium]